MQKVAVVLFNLGGPDSKAAIRPFLLNFFMDKNIIRLPVPFRCLLAWAIANKRSKREAGDSYGALGDQSPLLANSREQAKALERLLKREAGSEFKVFVSMRYWHPMAPQVVREVRDWGADRIVILPLYQQFSTTTTRSSLQVWDKAMREAGYARPTSIICCYPKNEGFLRASAENIKAEYDRAMKNGDSNIRLLFSAHGLPESVIKEGDPYQWQCEESAKAIVAVLESRYGLKNLDWTICYQSRVGPKKWIGPSTEEEIERAARDKKAVLIYPHAFSQEHVETLVELDLEYKEKAESLGLHGYYRARTAGTHPDFIEGMAGMVQKHLHKTGTYGEGGLCLCPDQWGQCGMRTAPSPAAAAAI
jgi:ferrochelatase